MALDLCELIAGDTDRAICESERDIKVKGGVVTTSKIAKPLVTVGM